MRNKYQPKLIINNKLREFEQRFVRASRFEDGKLLVEVSLLTIDELKVWLSKAFEDVYQSQSRTFRAKQKSLGLCVKCTLPAVNKCYCEKHRKLDAIRVREYYRKRRLGL